MNETFLEKSRKARATASYCLVKDRKNVLLARLGQAIQKLKEARKELHKVIQLTLEMKEAGDDLANPVITAVAETFASDGNSLILRDYISETN